MSTTNPRTNSRHGLDEPPEFELSVRFDDREDPTEVTVFPDDEGDLTTEWLTIDSGYVLPIEETR